MGRTANNAYVRQCLPLGTGGDTCAADRECGQNLVCNQGVQPAECRSPGVAGDPCHETNDCAEPLTCNGARDDTCQPAGQEDDPCRDAPDCASDLQCNLATDLCEAPGTGDEGEACVDRSNCGPDLVCRPAPTPEGARRCQPPVPLAGLCERDSDCAEGLSCSAGEDDVARCVE